MNEIPLWQVLLMHVAPVITALAAWRSAARGARTSKRNQDTLLIVHDLVNGRYAELEAKLERAERAAGKLAERDSR